MTNDTIHYRSENTPALKGGRWVRRGLVWVWEYDGQTATAAKPDRWSRQEAARREVEEQRYDEDEARRAHTAYQQGARSEWATTGHRVYCRRLYRARAEREAS